MAVKKNKNNHKSPRNCLSKNMWNFFIKSDKTILRNKQQLDSW